MSSIIGENWKNATSADVAGIDVLINAKVKQLNDASALLSQALDAIAKCGNSASGCLSKTGRHISTWRDQRDTYSPIVARYKTELQDLQAQRKLLTDAINKDALTGQVVAQTNISTAAATEAIAKAETVQATATASKLGIYALIGGIGIAVVIGGIFAFKYFKKK